MDNSSLVRAPNVPPVLLITSFFLLHTWELIVRLSRFGGIRTPSETLSLRWVDIDWATNRMNVYEPKVEHHEGRGVRSVPLFPEIRDVLERVWEAAPEGAEFVVDKPAYREAAMTAAGWANSNLRTQLLKRVEAAGVTPWPRLFHSMRASRQTELERQFPRHVVCAWMGNSAAVAAKSYLLVTEDDFTQAIDLDGAKTGGTKSGTIDREIDSKVARNPAPQVPATSTQPNDKTPENTGETTVFPTLSGVSGMEAGEHQ